MPTVGDWYGWQNFTSGTAVSLYATTNATSAYPYCVGYAQQPALPAVMESPAASLGDRDWLDAQIAEVCELAEAA